MRVPGVFLFHRRIVVPKQQAEQPTIVLDVGVNRSREAVRVNPVAIWLIILLITWIVDQQSVQRGRATNHNTIHDMGLVLGPLDMIILIMVKETQGKEREIHVRSS